MRLVGPASGSRAISSVEGVRVGSGADSIVVVDGVDGEVGVGDRLPSRSRKDVNGISGLEGSIELVHDLSRLGERQGLGQAGQGSGHEKLRMSVKAKQRDGEIAYLTNGHVEEDRKD